MNYPHTVDWDAVIEKIENGEVPHEFCSTYYSDMPDSPAMIARKARAEPGFAARLAEAKRMGAICMLAECKQIADNPSMRADQKKIMIDVRMRLAAIWNPSDCREVSKTESVTTVRNMTPRDEYIEQMVLYTGCTREGAAALYARNAGEAVQ
jgi:hypothetical protein